MVVIYAIINLKKFKRFYAIKAKNSWTNLELQPIALWNKNHKNIKMLLDLVKFL